MPGRAHADHNEQLCDLLLSDGRFDDWVITTAFYSAIHLVDHQIFPLTIGNEAEFKTFAQYCSRKAYGQAPHKIRRDFVGRHLPANCVAAFNWLYDAAHGARYNNYKIAPGIASQARTKLDQLKKCCNKPA